MNSVFVVMQKLFSGDTEIIAIANSEEVAIAIIEYYCELEDKGEFESEYGLSWKSYPVIQELRTESNS